MKDKTIVLGITGGIAAFKSASIASSLTQQGVQVKVIMTRSAQEFITPLTLQTVTRNPVAVDTFEENRPEVVNHIDLADHADLFLVAPATANFIGKYAHGIADDMLTTTLLATEAPVVIAPAMNVHMYAHPAVQRNLKQLRSQGVHLLDPESGQLACGYVGRGRMVEPETIVDWLGQFWSRKQRLQGKKVLITAGPTIEPLDPVRYLSNYSSGKMGYALAEAAVAMGAEVVLVSGPVSLSTPVGVRRISVETAEQMRAAVLGEFDDADLTIKAAAVSDYRPKCYSEQKLKKNGSKAEMELVLVQNPDIASELGRQKREDQVLVGFAAETDLLSTHAQEKLHRKGLDLIIANQVTEPGSGFGVDTNRVTVWDKQGQAHPFPKQSKGILAQQLLNWIGDIYYAENHR